jgi:ERCC4-type nuclease
LPLGDIILHDPRQGEQKDIVIFERKALADLAASIRDGRYKEQSFRLIETAAASGFHKHNIVYIIEGDLARYDERHTQITKTALQSAMVSLMYYKGFSVVRTMNVGETAEFILNFADKVAKESAAGLVPAYDVVSGGDDTTTTTSATPAQVYSEVSAKKEKRDYITRENIGEIMLAQVPGVSAKMAAAILAKYGGSIYEFLGDLHRKIDDYEESLSPEEMSGSPAGAVLDLAIVTTDATDARPPSAMNKNKYKHVSECFKDVTVDGKRGIGKLTVEKVCYFLG